MIFRNLFPRYLNALNSQNITISIEESVKMDIQILGGKGEVGGNKVLLEHKGTRILLDFGISFHTLKKYYSEFLNPRKGAALKDYFEMGLLPDIPGIYRGDYLKHMGRPREDRSVDAVFLTHAHLDHLQYIQFLRWDIPIYCTRITQLVIQSIQETSYFPADYTEVGESFQFYEGKDGSPNRVTRRNKEFTHERPFNILKPAESVIIGSLEIESYPVDHSMPGACGYIIHSDEGNLVYSGDLRFHGSNGHLTEKFVEKAQSVNPNWLLVEGTNIKKTTGTTEAQVRYDMTNFMGLTDGLVFVEHPARDLDRVHTIFQAAKANDRQFVIPMKLAHLIQTLNSDEDNPLSPVLLDKIKILIPLKGWGLINMPHISDRQIEYDYQYWERDFLQCENAITYEELSKNPRKYAVSMNLWQIKDLIDIQPRNAIWIKSTVKPFSTEMELDEKQKQNWLDHFNIKQYHTHASGHASGQDIQKMIEKINPKEVIAIHTEYPELYERE